MPLYFTSRFFYCVGAIAALFISSWLFSFSIDIPQALLAAFVVLVCTDAGVLMANKRSVKCVRHMADRFSNGDKNAVGLKLQNFYPFPIHVQVVEELPEQFQSRNNTFKIKMGPLASHVFRYYLKPLKRGEYDFGDTLLFICSPLQLVQRRMRSDNETMVKVYPSFVQMRRYELLAHTAQQTEAGGRQLRKIGHSLEFEQIKEYVAGDDIRAINWKASARRGSMMTNHFVDEKSQQVYCIIDKGRLMKMPFDGLSLLDYAINASLVLCNVCLHRQDKFGLLTFSHKAGSIVPADRKPVQLNHVLQSLYKLNTHFLESDFEKLYLQVRTCIKHRSLLVLFTNFESLSGMKRQLPYLKQIAKHHLLLVVFFENTELKEIAEKPVHDLESVYTKTIAGKFVFEKRMIVKELVQHGILAMATTPQMLTINAVNKYLELKKRQAI